MGKLLSVKLSRRSHWNFQLTCPKLIAFAFEKSKPQYLKTRDAFGQTWMAAPTSLENFDRSNIYITVRQIREH
jgi:hypothetical protein